MSHEQATNEYLEAEEAIARLGKNLNKRVMQMFDKASADYDELNAKKRIVENDKQKIQTVCWPEGSGGQQQCYGDVHAQAAAFAGHCSCCHLNCSHRACCRTLTGSVFCLRWDAKPMHIPRNAYGTVPATTPVFATCTYHDCHTSACDCTGSLKVYSFLSHMRLVSR